MRLGAARSKAWYGKEHTRFVFLDRAHIGSITILHQHLCEARLLSILQDRNYAAPLLCASTYPSSNRIDSLIVSALFINGEVLVRKHGIETGVREGVEERLVCAGTLQTKSERENRVRTKQGAKEEENEEFPHLKKGDRVSVGYGTYPV